MAEPLERVQREVRIAEPAEAVVPRASRAGVLRDARRRRGEEGARVLVLVELERERRADHLVLVLARYARPLDPAAPVVERPLEEALCGLLEADLERLPPRQDEVSVLLEEKRALVLDVRQRDVRRQPNRRRKARVLDVVRRSPGCDLCEAVLVCGPAPHARLRLARERSHDPDEHGRLEEAVVEVEARCEVDELERAARAVEHRSQHVRVLDVLLADLLGSDALYHEGSGSLAVEQRAEDEARIGTWPAEPLHRSVPEERAVGAVADDAEAVGHGEKLFEDA